MYPSDFSAAEPALSAVEPPVFLGLEPLLAILLLLLVLAVAVGMFLMGRWHAEQGVSGSDADRAPDEIHKAVLNASMAAMAASSDELKSRTQALRTAITDYLGPVLEVAKGVAGPVKALDEALKGEVKEPPKVEPAHGTAHGHGHGQEARAAPGCSCGKAQACTCGAPAGPAVTITHVHVGTGPAAPAAGCGCSGTHKPGCDHARGDHGPDKPKAEVKPETRAMSGPEQIDALSRAVRQFHDHWSRAPERVRELRAARAALSRRPPLSALKSRDGRVWDR